MSLTPEWRDRLNLWIRELPNHFFRQLGTLDLEGFVTRDQLTPQQAARGRFRRMAPGTTWGGKWEYGWFRGTVRVPAAAVGQRLVFRPAVGGESLVFVDGVERGSTSWGRSEITLTRRARAGEKFSILLESYAGHGPTPCGAGPLPPGRRAVPETPAAQQKVETSAYGVWNEDAWALAADVTALLGVRDNLDANSLRVARIDAGLRDFTSLVDYELPDEERGATFRQARRRLAPLLACRNGATAPALYAFGHGHLDVAWLWPLAETERKAARTFSSQLELIAEYPEHRFLQSEPHVYWMVQRLYPALFRRVQKAVKEGRLIAEGAMWVEPDMNVAGGEALIRQCVHGKRFFREHLGVNCELLWLPDVFGYSAALPQILRGCGVKYFATAKIFWNYHGGESFPHNTFTWEGIDGSTVLAHLFSNYGGPGASGDAIRRWNDRPQKDGISSLVFCYGHGDGGGGPTREHVENVLRLRDIEGCPRVRTASPVQLFKDVERAGGPPVRYVGELYFQAHRGTYTSQARTKLGNRRSEIALREAEMWGSAARALAGRRFPQAEMDATWKKLLLNQFHDILPGSSIGRVYEEAEAALDAIIATAERVARASAGKLVRRARAVTVFNSLSWDRKVLVELPPDFEGAEDAAGQPLCTQSVRGRKLVETPVPACGWTTVRAAPAHRDACCRADSVRATAGSIENDRISVRFNDRGEMASVFDKEAGREIADAPCGSLRLFKDVPTGWDAWDINSCYMATPVPLPERARITVVTSGLLLGRLKIERRIGNSRLTQIVTLRRGSRRVDFDTTVDWAECHRMLKVAFPVKVHSDHALHEIQFGHVRRPNHYSRQYDADRFEVAQHRWTALAEEGRGVAVLNDCKYGVNVVGNSINLTLLRSPKAPDPNADQGLQRFTYAFYAWNGSLGESGIVREGYDLNVPPMHVAGAGGENSLFRVSAPNVVIEAVKPAEDGSRDIVVRLYECMHTATGCELVTALPVSAARETDMLEEKTVARLRAAEGRIALEFHPFEIKTVRLSLKPPPRP